MIEYLSEPVAIHRNNDNAIIMFLKSETQDKNEKELQRRVADYLVFKNGLFDEEEKNRSFYLIKFLKNNILSF